MKYLQFMLEAVWKRNPIFMFEWVGFEWKIAVKLGRCLEGEGDYTWGKRTRSGVTMSISHLITLHPRWAVWPCAYIVSCIISQLQSLALNRNSHPRAESNVLGSPHSRSTSSRSFHEHSLWSTAEALLVGIPHVRNGFTMTLKLA